jgi:hypothetical protein
LNKALLDTDIYSEILKAIDQTVTRNATAYWQVHGRLSFSAVAIKNGLELVTGNTSHYQRIQQLGYSITLVGWRI